uniref:TrbI/VirB10 family protein n=1 Tax=Dialister sp. TaxID=1955814 RepID=UPI0040252E7B
MNMNLRDKLKGIKGRISHAHSEAPEDFDLDDAKKMSENPSEFAPLPPDPTASGFSSVPPNASAQGPSQTSSPSENTGDSLSGEPADTELGSLEAGDGATDTDDLSMVKKKQIAMVIAGVSILGISYMAGSVLFGGDKDLKPKEGQNQPTTIETAKSSLGKQMPDNYGTIAGYSRKANPKNAPNAKGGAAPGNPNAKPGSTINNTNYDDLAPKPLPSISQSSSSSSGVSNQSSGSSREYYDDSAARQREQQEAQEAAEEQQTAYTSAISFTNAVSRSANASANSAPDSSSKTVTLTQKGTGDAAFFEDDAGGATYVLRSGSVIDATLLTGINTDMGNTDIVAQISSNIYDSLSGDHLLIPQGSRLIGKAGSVSGTGVSVAFTRLEFPDGSGIDLPSVGAVDGTGIPGLRDQYSTHDSTFLRGALFSALLSYAANQAEDTSGSTSTTTTYTPWGTSRTTTDTNNAFGATIKKITKRWIDRADSQASRNPTVTIRPGMNFAVYINSDLSIPEYEGY